MITFTKEQLIASAHARIEFAEMMSSGDLEPLKERTWSIELELARIALASLEAEKEYKHHSVISEQLTHVLSGLDATDHQRAVISCAIDRLNNVAEILQRSPSALTAPPAPVSVPDEATPDNIDILASTYAPRGVTFQWDRDECNAAADSWNACRDAMLQGAEPVTTACKLPDDFDFDRFNDVVWLEAVASNPHMHSPTTSTIAMVALELNRKLADGNSPVIPDGWVMVPVEPTENMIVEGFESEPDESFSDPAVWEEYQAMSGCQQAAHRAKLCWAAMIAAAPKPGDSNG
ncbi:hypothetical protein [Enterobacter asburiae]|uniref:hypothetical protein n=1 Tax=Enterobacter asburiae TaxID=61645 RepID=UPI003F433279